MKTLSIYLVLCLAVLVLGIGIQSAEADPPPYTTSIDVGYIQLSSGADGLIVNLENITKIQRDPSANGLPIYIHYQSSEIDTLTTPEAVALKDALLAMMNGYID